MKPFITYLNKATSANYLLMDHLSVSKQSNLTLETDKGEVFLKECVLIEYNHKTYVRALGTDNYSCSSIGDHPKLDFLDTSYLSDEEKLVLGKMTSIAKMFPRYTIRLRTRGMNRGCLYVTRIKTTLSDKGVITRGFE